MPADGVPPGDNWLHRDSRSVKDGEEDTEERVKVPQNEICEESEVTSVVTQSQVEQTRTATAEQELENALTQTLVTTLTTGNRRGEARSTRGREHSLARCCGTASGHRVKSESSSTRVTKKKR